MLALALALTTTGLAVTAVQHLGRCTPESSVAVRAVDDLDVFTTWLDRNRVKGFIGEVGWPSDDPRWSAVATAWFDRADERGLWVTVWAAGRWWPRTYQMAAYRLTGVPGSPPGTGPQADVLADHPGPPGTLRGVVLPGGAFAAGRDGPPSYSGSDPGRPGYAYYYEDALDFRQLARQGVSLVRISFAWERIQHSPGGPLNAAEVRRLRSSLAAADRAGLGVVLDLHNYGDYWSADRTGAQHRLVLGTPALPAGTLADLWVRLTGALGDATPLLGLGLMNEPVAMASGPRTGARAWERASQDAVTALRRAGRRQTVFVSGYAGASPATWTTFHPLAWIKDPEQQVRYEAHQYFDSDRSGRYAAAFNREARTATTAGYDGACVSAASGADPFTPSAAHPRTRESYQERATP